MALQHSLVSVFTPSLMSAADLEHIFVQREPLAQDLVKRIVNSTKGKGKEHSLLIGKRGMGKTHLVSLVYHRVQAMPELREKLLIAWLREEEWGVDSWLDLVMRILRAVAEDRSSADSGMAQDLLDRLRQGGWESAKGSATQFLRDLIGKRTLLLIIENMDDLFQGLKEAGQQEFRAFLQEYRCCTVLATTPAIFSGVSSRKEPFFGFFHNAHLEPIDVDEAVKMLGQIASLRRVGDESRELAIFLQSAEGRARVRAVQHLAGGNPRVYTLFAQFITKESLDDLVDAFMKMLDDLTPYYQSRMKDLSNQQRKIVELLVDRRRAVMVKEIGNDCFLDPRSVASQLNDLKKKGYVVTTQAGRESCYELSEVLMRFCMEVKKFRGQWVELVVDFLKVWYRPHQRRGMLEKFGNSKLMARHDLERAFLSDDDPLGDFCIREFQKSLKQKNHATILQIAEELQAIAVITPEEYQQFLALTEKKEYAEILHLLEQSKSSQGKSQQPKSADELLLEGLLLEMQEKWLEAIASYERALEIKPDGHEAWYARGTSLLMSGRYEEAIASYDRVLAIKPDDHEAWNSRGDSLLMLERYEQAIASYDRAIEINPSNGSAWPNKGGAYFRLSKYCESISCYDQCLKIQPDRYNSWHDKGLVQFVTSDYAAALATWQQAFKYIGDPKVPRYYEDISGLIQEFIEELIPRFTQPPIQQTLLIPLLEIYREAQVITELGAALVNTLHLIVAPAISNHTAAQWLTFWRTSSLGSAPAMELPLRLMETAIEYKKDPSKRQRLWLNLPQEERPLLNQALKFLD